ncbi:MAG TPA: ABC transporter ATP-binding protein [Acidimicrobiales bacterium]|nr:ABC transporter ATP-binding protein [Acidimicrobiales bacterium]
MNNENVDLSHGGRSSSSTTRNETIAISVENVSKNFGGVAALSDVSFTTKEGSLTALIGPNGAGKSTLFNIASGTLPATSGEVRLFGTTVRDGAPHKVARAGLSRTFQSTRVFPLLSVLENLTVAHLSRKEARQIWVPRRWRSEAREIARRVANEYGLERELDVLAKDLSIAEMRVLMLTVAVIRDPRIIFLDEIVAGMDAKACHEIANHLRLLSSGGTTILLVEHNLSFVWETAAHVVVLDAGKLIAQGTPEQVQQDPEVGRVYFGSELR